jgi:hypothetical protein
MMGWQSKLMLKRLAERGGEEVMVGWQWTQK